MEHGPDRRVGAIVIGAVLGATWLALIVTAMVALGPLVGLVLGVWGVSFVVAALAGAVVGARAAAARFRSKQDAGAVVPAT